MNEMTLIYILGWTSAFAVIGPVFALGYTVYREIFARKFVFIDEHGKPIGELSAESVQRDTGELVEMHKRIRQSEHVSIRAAA